MTLDNCGPSRARLESRIMSGLPVEALLAPLTAEAPCGADLSYDAAFQALEDAARGKPEQQFGDTIIAAEAPDWRVVHSQALDLAARTRDLRIAIYLWRAATKQSQVAGFAQGLELILGLLDRHWSHVFPLLDAEDNNDPTMRLNALAPLADAQGVHVELRSLRIGSAKSGLTLRDLELALGKTQPRAGESVRSVDSIVKAIEDQEAESPGALEAMQQAHRSLLAIDALLASRVPGLGPDLKSLARLTQMLADAASRAAGQPAATLDAEPGVAPAVARASGAPGTIASRADALAALDRVCTWFESNEPSHPAPLLIRRAQRLMSKNFIDIIKDLVPDGIDQVHKIAGAAPE